MMDSRLDIVRTVLKDILDEIAIETIDGVCIQFDRQPQNKS